MKNQVMLDATIESFVVRETKDGGSFCTMRLVFPRMWNKTMKKSKISAVIWPPASTKAIEELKNGVHLTIYGKIEERSWLDKEGNWHNPHQIYFEEWDLLQHDPFDDVPAGKDEQREPGSDDEPAF